MNTRSQFALPHGPLGRAAGRLMGRTNRPTAEAMVRRLGLTGSERVLEIGFGPGVALELIVHSAASVAGVDPSETMLAMARRRVPSAGLRAAGVSFLPWPDAFFDRICSMNSIMLWPDLPRELAEVTRVAAEGPRAVIAVRDHSIEKRHGGLLRPDIEDVVEKLARLGWKAALEHERAVAFIVADRLPG